MWNGKLLNSVTWTVGLWKKQRKETVTGLREQLRNGGTVWKSSMLT